MAEKKDDKNNKEPYNPIVPVEGEPQPEPGLVNGDFV